MSPSRRIVASVWVVAVMAGCEAAGSLGAPCENGNDCDEGLLCDLHDGGSSCQAPHQDHAEPAASTCSSEIRDDTYALGLGKQGAWTTVAFVDALPAPPSRGDNAWTVHVTDHGGAPLAGLAIEVEPFMPDHFHGTAIRCEVIESEVAGDYLLTPVNLFMPGLWEVTLTLEDGHREDSVVFSFCLDP